MLRRKLISAAGLLAAAASIFMIGCANDASTTLAVVSITPGTGAVFAGATVQFSASATGTTGAVTWSVDGVAGGSATTGTISSSGLYQAPAQVTGALSVTVEASVGSGSGGTASATVAVFAPGKVSSTNNAQVALYSFGAPDGGSVEIEFGPDTNYGLKTWSQPAPSGGGAVNILVAGMRAHTTYHMKAVAHLSDGSEFTDSDQSFTTGGLASNQLPSLTAQTTLGMTPNPGIEVVELVPVGPSTVSNFVVTDLNANVLWYHNDGAPGTVTQPVKLLPDGNFLVNYSNGLADGTDSLLEEIDLAGDAVWQLNATDLNQALAAAGYDLTIVGTHHDVAVLPNGHLVVIAAMIKNFTDLVGYPGTTAVTGDVLIDLDTNRKPVWVWSSFDHLDINRHPLSFPDWTHTNAILYSVDDGNLVVSMRHQHWLLKIDYEDGKGTGDILWKLGWQGDFALQGGTDPVDWFYAQHGPSFVGPNTSGVFKLALFDNGDSRVLDSSGTVCTTSCYSRVPILQIDESAKTATIDWLDAPLTYSFFGGNAEVLANDNVEFDESATTFAPANSAAYEVTQDSAPETVWEMTIAGEYSYRVFRIPSFYPGVQW